MAITKDRANGTWKLTTNGTTAVQNADASDADANSGPIPPGRWLVQIPDLGTLTAWFQWRAYVAGEAAPNIATDPPSFPLPGGISKAFTMRVIAGYNDRVTIKLSGAGAHAVYFTPIADEGEVL